MSQEGYADSITNDRPRFCSITPVSELTELVFELKRSGQVTELSPSGCEESDGVTHTNSHRPPRRPDKARGAQMPRDRDSELASTGSATSGYGSWDRDSELTSIGSATSSYGSWDRDSELASIG